MSASRRSYILVNWGFPPFCCASPHDALAACCKLPQLDQMQGGKTPADANVSTTVQRFYFFLHSKNLNPDSFENPVHFHCTFTIPSRFYHKKLWNFQFVLDSRSSCLWEAVLFLLKNLILSLHFCPKQSKMLALSPVKQHCRCHTEALQSLGFTAAYLIPLFSLGWASRYSRADFNPPWKTSFKISLDSQWFSTCPSLSFVLKALPKISAKCKWLESSSFRYHFNTSILSSDAPGIHERDLWWQWAVSPALMLCTATPPAGTRKADASCDTKTCHQRSKRKWQTPKSRLNWEVLLHVCWRCRSLMWRYIQY